MGFLMNLIKMFSVPYRDDIEKLKRQRRSIDKRIDKLEQVTLNGEDEWFIKVVRRDPSCALRVIKECDKDNHVPIR